MTTAHNFTTPVGRLVGGNVFKGNDKDFDGRPLMTRDNKPRVEYIAVVAIPKTDPGLGPMMQEIQAAAVEGFPTLFVNGQAPPTFSWKITDGDSTVPNMRGNKPCEKEGYPGHMVFTFKSSFAPKVFGPNVEPIVDEKAIKRGDYVRVGASCKGNNQQQKPGVYLNQSMLQLVGYGEEISSGPDAATVFAAPAVLPPGASPTPVAPAGGMPGMPATPGVPAAPGVPAGVAPQTPVPGAPPAPAMAGMPGMPGAAPAAGVPMPGMPAAPAPGVPMPGMPAAPAPGVPPNGAAPIAPAPPLAAAVAPPAPPAKQTVAGAPTYASLIAAGWTDEQMQAAGYLPPTLH